MPGVEQIELLSVWLLIALFFGFHLSQKNPLLARLFLLSAAARITVAVLQSGFGFFLANQDALGYAGQGLLIASNPGSYVLGDVSSGQLGIIATNTFVSRFAGPIPSIVMASILASLVSSLAVVLVMAPFLGGPRNTTYESRNTRFAFCAAVFFPSFLFWGSQDLKEPFLMLGLAMFVFAFHADWPIKAILAPSGILICVAYRPYIGALVLGVGVLFVLARPARRKAPRATLMALVLTAVLVGTKYGSMVTGVELGQQEQFSQQAGGASVIPGAQGRFTLLGNIGEFFFAPLPWQTPNGVQGIIVYIESMLMGLLILRYLFLLLIRRREIVGDGALVAILLYCTSACIYAAGLANSGTLSRERSPFLLVLLPLLILPIYQSQMGACDSEGRIDSPRGSRGTTIQVLASSNRDYGRRKRWSGLVGLFEFHDEAGAGVRVTEGARGSAGMGVAKTSTIQRIHELCSSLRSRGATPHRTRIP